MRRMRVTGISSRCEASEPHLPHRFLHCLVVHGEPVPLELSGDSGRAVAGKGSVDLVDAIQKSNMLWGNRLWFVVVAGTADTEEFALPGNRDLGL